HQARILVASKVEAPAVFNKFQQGEELLVIRGGAHSASPFITNVTRAEGISSSGKMKSTVPVRIVAAGIPENSAVFSSSTMTVPPIVLMARAPIDPSLPVPVSTTAIARSL